jgi:hypothetical protein
VGRLFDELNRIKLSRLEDGFFAAGKTTSIPGWLYLQLILGILDEVVLEQVFS